MNNNKNTIPIFNKTLDKLIEEKKESSVKNLTLKQIAKEIGITESALLNYRTDRFPKVEKLINIKNYFGVPYSTLFGETTNTEINKVEFEINTGLDKESINVLEKTQKKINQLNEMIYKLKLLQNKDLNYIITELKSTKNKDYKKILEDICEKYNLIQEECINEDIIDIKEIISTEIRPLKKELSKLKAKNFFNNCLITDEELFENLIVIFSYYIDSKDFNYHHPNKYNSLNDYYKLQLNAEAKKICHKFFIGITDKLSDCKDKDELIEYFFKISEKYKAKEKCKKKINKQ